MTLRARWEAEWRPQALSKCFLGAGTGKHSSLRSFLALCGNAHVQRPNFGERKAIVAAEDWEGRTYQTSRNAASFELSRRRDNLPLDAIDHWQISRTQIGALPRSAETADGCETSNATPQPSQPLSASL